MEFLATVVVFGIILLALGGIHAGIKDRVRSETVALSLTGVFFVLLPVSVIAYFVGGPRASVWAPVFLLIGLVSIFGVFIAPLLVGGWVNLFLETRIPEAAAFIIAVFTWFGTMSLAIYGIWAVIDRYN